MAVKQQWAENDIKVNDASQEGFLAVIKYIYNKNLRMVFIAFLYYLADSTT